MSSSLIIAAAIAYIGLLFLIAYWTDRRSKRGISTVNNPYIYALSLAVYCTAWTFFGSVGKAAAAGIHFLPIYLGPTVSAVLWWFVLYKMILVSKAQRITSIADFISSRYGKSTLLGVIATLLAIASIVPYISIQLKAIAVSYDILTHEGVQAWSGEGLLAIPFYQDTAWYIAIALAIFAIIFGTRNLDPNERHEGLVVAVAFESVFKLIVFLLVGIFVCYGLFNGFGDLFAQAQAVPEIAATLFFDQETVDGWYWFWLMLLSMFAILLLPRQFHVAVVENTNPEFVKTATWLFPLYLFLINIFVLPIAVSGSLLQGTAANADMFVLSLPLLADQPFLSLLVALGGFSASTGMVIVAVTALAIMISNHLFMPALIQYAPTSARQTEDITDRLLGIRRVSIVIIMLLTYGYFKFVSASYGLVSIGLISFAGVAQFAPALLGGLFWKRATRKGAVWGLSVGAIVWGFCLPLPTLVEAGFFPISIIEEGLFGQAWLRPYTLFGMEGMDRLSHGAFWSLSLNTLTYVLVSINTIPSPLEAYQANVFVNIYDYLEDDSSHEVIRRTARFEDVFHVLRRFIGIEKTEEIVQSFTSRALRQLPPGTEVGEDFISVAERNLAGAIGAASAKIIINNIVQEEPISIEEMLRILDQTREIVAYSKVVEAKSQELEATTQQLRTANEQLQELDELKADFITTITHELRTPITSIKSLANILAENTDLPAADKEKYLAIIVSESARIARLVDQVLDWEKLQHALPTNNATRVAIRPLLETAAASIKPIMQERQIDFAVQLPTNSLHGHGQRDQLLQAILNLLSNASKFCASPNGQVQLAAKAVGREIEISVTDNGFGLSPHEMDNVFEKFTQFSDREHGKPPGTGLGLAITQTIVKQHGGRILVESSKGKGATFLIYLPLSQD
ncbi:MAG: sensor histidine kinase [Bacteroidota bacterium]